MGEIDWNELTAELEHELCRAAKKVAERHRLFEGFSVEFRVAQFGGQREHVEIDLRGHLELPTKSNPDAVTFPTDEQAMEWVQQGYNSVTLLPMKRWTEPISEGDLLARDSNGCLHLARAGEAPVGVALRSSDEREERDLSRPSDLVRRLQVRDLTKAITGMPLHDHEGHLAAVITDVDSTAQIIRIDWQGHHGWYPSGQEIPFSRVKEGMNLWLTRDDAQLIDKATLVEKMGSTAARYQENLIADALVKNDSSDAQLRPLREEDWEQLGCAWMPVLHDASGVQVAQIVEKSFWHLIDKRYVTVERIGGRWAFEIRSFPANPSVIEMPWDELLEAGLFVRRHEDEQRSVVERKEQPPSVRRGGLSRLASRMWLPSTSIEVQKRWADVHMAKLEELMGCDHRVLEASEAESAQGDLARHDYRVDSPFAVSRLELDELRLGFKQELLDELERNLPVVAKPDAKPDVKVDVRCDVSRFQEALAKHVQTYLDALVHDELLGVDVCRKGDGIEVSALPGSFNYAWLGAGVSGSAIEEQAESPQGDPYRCVCSHGGLNGCPGYRGTGRCVSLPEDDE